MPVLFVRQREKNGHYFFSKKNFLAFSYFCPAHLYQEVEGQKSPRKGGADMHGTPKPKPEVFSPDEELIDTLITISVIAKRLAEKLRKKKAFRCPLQGAAAM